MPKSRISLNDTVLDIVVKMSDGNPGAVSVMRSMIKDGEAIDPQGFMGGVGAVMLLDTFEIYGSRIWILAKDVCKQSLVHLLATIRACQLGIINKNTLNHAIDNDSDSIDTEALLVKVKGLLEKFDRI